MKLLNCLRCSDIVALNRKERKCFCGKSTGKYVDERVAEHTGPSRVLGMLNQEYLSAIPGNDYKWFIIPEGHNIQHVDKLDAENYWKPARNLEWSCPHGVGHPVPPRDPIHGCCHEGCCGREDFPGK